MTVARSVQGCLRIQETNLHLDDVSCETSFAEEVGSVRDRGKAVEMDMTEILEVRPIPSGDF
jgi:hypothetical protein